MANVDQESFSWPENLASPIPAAKESDESRQDSPAVDEAAIVGPGEEELSRQAFVKFYTGGFFRVEYKWGAKAH